MCLTSSTEGFHIRGYHVVLCTVLSIYLNNINIDSSHDLFIQTSETITGKNTVVAWLANARKTDCELYSVWCRILAMLHFGFVHNIFFFLFDMFQHKKIVQFYKSQALCV